MYKKSALQVKVGFIFLPFVHLSLVEKGAFCFSSTVYFPCWISELDTVESSFYLPFGWVVIDKSSFYLYDVQVDMMFKLAEILFYK